MPLGPSPRDPRPDSPRPTSRTQSVDNAIEVDTESLGLENNPYKEKGFNFYDERLLIAGKWVREKSAESIRFFFEILALCHTAIPEGTPEEPSLMRYRAESPDEAALVVAAKQFGFYFYKRTPTTLHVRESLRPGDPPRDQVYQLLDVLEFSSMRKRMSIIVRFPDGRLLLLSKGADLVILQRVDRKKSGPVAETILRGPNCALDSAHGARETAHFDVPFSFFPSISFSFNSSPCSWEMRWDPSAVENYL